ncbi:CLUMA_CG009557, isoform A [Clunio marinus]|uniref:CLUMA_CG009557, isoform A n=1 Tax=Clunio marinus TaxID=568069 RepID=A0A1J1I739_9DIPT|nr:CLUMA_CG009557, isoform A [Clunio marinus]
MKSRAWTMLGDYMINYLTCMSSTVFGGRDYIIICVLVIISGLTMSKVVQHCLLLVESLNENDMSNVVVMLDEKFFRLRSKMRHENKSTTKLHSVDRS